jgi:regulator of cell morphogenesis and NO signaling
MRSIEKETVGGIVAGDYRAAEVFSNFGIDFCCKGDLTLDEACHKKGIDKQELLKKLGDQLNDNEHRAEDYTVWPLNKLADHIEKKHHKYVEDKIPVIKEYLDKICKVHGDKHPELFAIRDEFHEAAGELTAHMKKEELILFPYIRRILFAKEERSALIPPHFGTVLNPVNMMRHEHTIEGERFERIAELSNNFTPPADACNTYRVTFALLKEFEEDMHLHIHLENNILFPKAIEMEGKLS